MKVERESSEPATTSRQRSLAVATGVVGVVWFAAQAYMSLFPTVVPVGQQRAIHLGLALAMAGVIWAATLKRSWVSRITVISLGIVGAAVEVYAYFEIREQALMNGLYRGPDLLISLVMVAVLVAFCVRYLGWALPIIAAVLLGVTMLGESLPGALQMAPPDLLRLFPATAFGTDGVHGVALDASARFIFMFVVFGAMLTEFGASQFLVRLVGRSLARRRGGAGKIAVVASALFGVTSDSTIANVSTTGVVTIPAMKKSGFSAERAAAIEAASAVGGQIVPPVLGTVAFIMAAMTGIPYAEIVVAAIVPAALYYFSLYLSVDRVAARDSIGGVDFDYHPQSKSAQAMDLVEYVLPVIVLLYYLVIERWEPAESVSRAMVLLVAVHLARHHNVAALRRLLRAIIAGSQRMVLVGIVCAFIGLIVGPVLITGLGLNLTGVLLSTAGTSLILLLVCTMVASFVLGSGLPTTATYIFLAVLVAPALVDLGIPVLAAHMMIMYFGVLSDLSPPTMVTVYVASGIAESRPMKTALYAMSCAMAGFVAPFMFVLRPEMLFVQGSAIDSILAIGIAGLVLILTVVAMVGRAFGQLATWARLGVVACAAVGALAPMTEAMIATALGIALLWMGSDARGRRGPRTSTANGIQEATPTPSHQ